MHARFPMVAKQYALTAVIVARFNVC